MNKVKQFRAHQKISQLSLARAVGVSRQTIN
ncbi:helix-turn-helix domain-containing protein, partial [Staphylococcus epidermidis]